jgi:O-antigen/teichoic acid export membrane protein
MDSRGHTVIRRVARDVLYLSVGTGVAQTIALVAMPLVTRLYNPGAFGQFAIFNAVLGLLLPLALLRYDWAMPLPSEELRAHELFALCLALVVASSLAIAALSALVGPILAERTNINRGIVMQLPLAMFVMSLHALTASWMARERAFARLSLVRFATVVGTLASQVVLGLLHAGASGLILGQVGGYMIGLIAGANHWGRALSNSMACLRLNSLRRTAVEYRAFAIYTAPVGVINVLGSQAPSLILPSLYGLTIAGQYSLGQRVIGQPAALVGSAVNQVFWVHAARLFVEEPIHLWHLFIRANVFLFGVMAPAFLLTWFGSQIFGFLFGAAWEEAGSFAGIMIFAAAVGLPAQSTTSLTSFRLNHWLSAWEIGRITLVMAALGAAWQLALSPFICITGMSTAFAISNVALFGLNAVAISRAKSQGLRRTTIEQQSSVASEVLVERGSQLKE